MGIDNEIVLKDVCALLLGVEVELFVVLDSCDLFTSLSTQRKSADRSVPADVNYIRYMFETEKANRFSGIPGHLDLADPVTKPDKPITKPLQ